LTLTEADALTKGFLELAQSGIDILALTDDAYFGLQYEENLLCESMFARLTGLHPNILAVKADGPTKEDYVWGFRIGFVTLEAQALKIPTTMRSAKDARYYPIECIELEQSSQNLLLKALNFPGYEQQKANYRQILEGRYIAMKRKLSAMKNQGKLPKGLVPLPFNSGYFMSFVCEGFSAEELRKKLLDEQGIGTISMQDRYLRVAFASVEEADI